MILSTTEILNRAYNFVAKWEGGRKSEKSEAQAFVIEFLNVFGVDRRVAATYLEYPLKKPTGAQGFVDCFWARQILIEMKKSGVDLEAAYRQAIDYCHSEVVKNQAPKGVLVCNFDEFFYQDFDTLEEIRFSLRDLPAYLKYFYFLSGYVKKTYAEQDPANIEATVLMGRLHDRLRALKYDPKELELYLARLLFCLFADDSGVFDKDELLLYVRTKTDDDGSDLGAKLNELFEVLDTPEERRSPALDEDMARFPYVNGGLFHERLSVAHFDAEARAAFIQCCEFDWSGVSPILFGALFQCAMDQKERRNLGAHYTSEKNILKALDPLFLGELRDELKKIKILKTKSTRDKRLHEFHAKLKEIRVFDPACGCGNFLVVAYRELRLLENEVLKELFGERTGERSAFLSTDFQSWVDVDQFYGIEIEELPSQIARVALWLTDHQMNQQTSLILGKYFARIPLVTSPNILCANALRVDWESVAPKDKISYIVGNPPFVGARMQSKRQKDEALGVFHDVKGAGDLDYVACWYRKASEFIQGTAIECAFVSTNSICQGIQAGLLWKNLTTKYGVTINFAHRTFAWSNEVAKRAAVFCVIIGFSTKERKEKFLFYYPNKRSEATKEKVVKINEYLIEQSSIFIQNRSTPLCDVPVMGIGNKPIDGGTYLFDDQRKADFLKKEPKAEKYFHRWMGAVEFLHNRSRWVLWLGDASPAEINASPELKKLVEEVRTYRLQSPSKPTQELADRPTRFHVENMPSREYLAIPGTTSENRKYIPFGFLPPDVFCGDSMKIVPNASLYHFGVLSSRMSMVWTNAVCGRLKNDYRYSAKIVYNNFPWPDEHFERRTKIEDEARRVLNVRSLYPNSSLDDLYSTFSMPDDLFKAHQKLDDAVERAYRKERFQSDEERLAFLFARYLELNVLSDH